MWKPQRGCAEQTRFKSCFLARIQTGSTPPRALAIPANTTNISKPSPLAPGREGVAGRVLLERKPVQIVDVLADPEYGLPEVQRLGGFRTHLGLPLLREDSVIGVLLVSRTVVEPFDDKHIELLSTFAAQAVIAIENARLLNELRQRTTDLTERTGDLTEALEQQTATSEVLQVISSSPGDLEPVFQAMLENAVRICHAKFGIIYRWDGDALHLVASHNVPPAFADARRRSPRRLRPEAPTGRMIANKTVIHTANLAAEQTYIERDPDTVTSVEVGGVRSLLSVPMLKENELIGGFTVSRQEVRPFTDKQIELVKNFAAQAVIAIENAWLLNELRQRTHRRPHRSLRTADRHVTSASGYLKLSRASLSQYLRQCWPVPRAFARRSSAIFSFVRARRSARLRGTASQHTSRIGRERR